MRREQRAPEISPQSRRILWRLSALFALDSFAGGFLGSALFAYFFYAQFGVGEGTIAALFVGARIMNAFSHLAAAWLARRIGLINTMVFTHTPSSLLLLTIPFTDSFALAAVLFLLREGLSEMDVPTRQSYLMAMVRPEERTFAGGVTNLARMTARAVAPIIAGGAMQAALWTPLAAAAAMKIAYDWILWVQFRRVRPPEEDRKFTGTPKADGQMGLSTQAAFSRLLAATYAFESRAFSWEWAKKCRAALHIGRSRAGTRTQNDEN